MDIMRNSLESGVERTKRKNKIKVTQEPVERKVNKNIWKCENTSKKRKDPLTQKKKEGRIARWKNTRKLKNRAEEKWWKGRTLSRYVMEG